MFSFVLHLHATIVNGVSLALFESQKAQRIEGSLSLRQYQIWSNQGRSLGLHLHHDMLFFLFGPNQAPSSPDNQIARGSRHVPLVVFRLIGLFSGRHIHRTLVSSWVLNGSSAGFSWMCSFAWRLSWDTKSTFFWYEGVSCVCPVWISAFRFAHVTCSTFVFKRFYMWVSTCSWISGVIRTLGS